MMTNNDYDWQMRQESLMRKDEREMHRARGFYDPPHDPNDVPKKAAKGGAPAIVPPPEGDPSVVPHPEGGAQ